jgi:uncharacterized protein (TIGR02246 family)
MIKCRAQLIGFMVALALSGGCAHHGGPSARPELAATDSPVREQVSALCDQWATAFARGDLAGLVRLYDSSAVLWGVSSSGPTKGLSGVREYYRQVLSLAPEAKIVLRPTHVRVLPTSAVTSGTYVLKARTTETAIPKTGRYTMVLERHTDRWVIVEHHMSFAGY